MTGPSQLAGVEKTPVTFSEPWWVEEARKAFIKRFTREHYGIDIDDCNQVYGDPK